MDAIYLKNIQPYCNQWVLESGHMGISYLDKFGFLALVSNVLHGTMMLTPREYPQHFCNITITSDSKN